MAKPALFLNFEKGPKNGTRLECKLTSATNLGRARSNTLQISKDSGISQKHLAFRWNSDFDSGPAWTVTDLGSSNGTILNGIQIEAEKPFALRDGDIVKIGAETTIRVDIQGAAEKAEFQATTNTTTRSRGRGTSTRAANNGKSLTATEIRRKRAHATSMKEPVRETLDLTMEETDVMEPPKFLTNLSTSTDDFASTIGKDLTLSIDKFQSRTGRDLTSSNQKLRSSAVKGLIASTDSFQSKSGRDLTTSTQKLRSSAIKDLKTSTQKLRSSAIKELTTSTQKLRSSAVKELTASTQKLRSSAVKELTTSTQKLRSNGINDLTASTQKLRSSAVKELSAPVDKCQTIDENSVEKRDVGMTVEQWFQHMMEEGPKYLYQVSESIIQDLLLESKQFDDYVQSLT